MNNFRTYELAKQYYFEYQKIKLKAPLKNQFERASLSIVLNLSEGSGKPTRKDKRRFYYIAYASLNETRTLLELSGINHLEDLSNKLAAHIWKLAQNPGGV